MSTYTILHLKGECITSDKMFRDYFDLQEAMSLMRIIVEAGHNLFAGDDLRYLECLRESICGRIPKEIIVGEQGVSAIFEDGSEILLPYLTADGSQAGMVTVRDWQRILLSHLGHQPITVTITEPQQVASFTDTIELLNAEEPLRLRLFSLSPTLLCPIRTVKIVNRTYNESSIHIFVDNDNGDTIDILTLRHGECRFANMIGERLVEFLPIISLSRTQMGVIRFDESSRCVVSYKRNTQQTEESLAIDGITQFCVDEDKGLIAVCEGRLMARTNIFGINDTRFKLDSSEQIVKVSIMGKSLLALSSHGKVYSNIPAFRRLDKLNIVSIGINWDGTPYYLSSDGVLNSGLNHCGDVYSVISTNVDSFSLKLRSGHIHYSNKEFLPVIPQKSVCINGKEYRLDLQGATLYLDDTTCELADHVDDFDLQKTSDGYNLVVCSNEMLQVIKAC